MDESQSSLSFVALRLIKSNKLLVKEPNTPLTLKLNLVEPLTDAQFRLLSMATPSNPINITAYVGKWTTYQQAFDSYVVLIESPYKPPIHQHTKTLRWGLSKRKRGFISHDQL